MKKVLICDDEIIIRQGIRKIVQSTFRDLAIEEREDGLEGYKCLTTFLPDVVITDIKMPMLSGLGMIERAAASGIKTNFVIISAYSDFDYAKTAIKYGVKDYILKPVNHFELIDCLNAVWGIKDKQDPAENPVQMEDSGIIGKAAQYIENNFYKNISLEDVSQAINMNTNYFSALFKKQTGKKYIDYLTELRMEKARQLICNTDLTISNICEMVGYNSTKYFTRIYKERFGVTPSSER